MGVDSITLDTISVAREPPSLGGGALPGSGSYGDPIQGLGQSNAQMKDTLGAFTATLNATNTLNAGFEAGNAARNATLQSQNATGFDAAQARRETMFAAPPVTGPMLPPNFAETARVPTTFASGAIPAAEPKAAQLALNDGQESPPALSTVEPSWLERGWAGITEAASAAADAIGQFDRDHANILTGGAGVLQAVGGAGETVLGGGIAGFGGMASATGVGAAPGIPATIGGSLLIANGLDNAQAGLRTAVTGQFQDTLAAEAAGGIVQAAGASSDQAAAARLGANLASGAISLGGGLAAGIRATGRAAEASSGMPSSSKFSGIERASPELLDAVGRKRAVVIAEPGSDEAKLLDYFGAEASVNTSENGMRNGSIILRQDPSKAAVLEEFLHGTQARLGIVDRLGESGLGSAETHVKDFMIRHQRMLGLGADDVKILQMLRDEGL